MKIYDWILFDADGTLFHFDAFSGLKAMFLVHRKPRTYDIKLSYEVSSLTELKRLIVKIG